MCIGQSILNRGDKCENERTILYYWAQTDLFWIVIFVIYHQPSLYGISFFGRGGGGGKEGWDGVIS